MKNFKEILNPYKGLPKEIYINFICKIVVCIGAFVHPLLTLILTKKIGLSSAQAGIFITILALIQTPVVLISGKLTDIVGRKRIIVISQGLGILSFFIAGFIKPSMTMIYIIMIGSILFAMANPAYEAMNADLTNTENRKASYSLIYMGVNLGFAIGPMIGGALFEHHLKWLFIGDALTTLIALILFCVFIKETKGKKAVENKNVLENHVEGSAISIIKQRPVILYYAIAMFVIGFAYSQWGFMLPMHLEHMFTHFGAKFFGYLGAINGLVVIIFTPFLTTITKKMNPISVMTAGSILYGISFLSFGFMNNIFLYGVAVTVMTIGEVLLSINTGAYIASKIPASHRGRISSILPMISSAGYMLGPLVFGKLLLTYGGTVCWIIVGIIAFIGAILVKSLSRFES